mmetsp:Transcript_97322/g.278511  ORF Transcript_97322/g.278511 Transcript_97322/m.278511 type:complete len:225 (+) Transcript_97322:413-1087(+)
MVGRGHEDKVASESRAPLLGHVQDVRDPALLVVSVTARSPIRVGHCVVARLVAGGPRDCRSIYLRKTDVSNPCLHPPAIEYSGELNHDLVVVVVLVLLIHGFEVELVPSAVRFVNLEVLRLVQLPMQRSGFVLPQEISYLNRLVASHSFCEHSLELVPFSPPRTQPLCQLLVCCAGTIFNRRWFAVRADSLFHGGGYFRFSAFLLPVAIREVIFERIHVFGDEL